MTPSIHSSGAWEQDDFDVALLDDEPPLGFDCGREEQNDFLYRWAWSDQQQMFSATRLFFVKGILAGYATTFTEAVDLGSREKERGVRYASLAAIKLGQLAVDRRFAGRGLGRLLIGYIVDYARRLGKEVGCRYLIVDARPELEGWYAAQGFVRNKLEQKRKLERARATGRDEATVTVSMWFDLLELP